MVISRRCQVSTKTNYTTYFERRSAPVRLFIRQPPVHGLLLHTNIIALEALNKSEQVVIKYTLQMAFGCDSWLLLLKVIEPLRTYPDKTSFHAQFQVKSVRFEDVQGASKAEATFRGNGLCASCPIDESTTNLTEVETLQLDFARHQTAVAGALVALVHRVGLVGETPPQQYGIE